METFALLLFNEFANAHSRMVECYFSVAYFLALQPMPVCFKQVACNALRLGQIAYAGTVSVAFVILAVVVNVTVGYLKTA